MFKRLKNKNKKQKSIKYTGQINRKEKKET